ncbi:MAG: response regulator, partial [Anaerolineales bacterium]
MVGTILYIEDNPDNILLVRRAMEARGHTFLWAADGLSGIEQVESARPDLILLDINLPDIDGYEV